MTVVDNDIMVVNTGQLVDGIHNIQNVYQMRLEAGGPVDEADVVTDIGTILQLIVNILKLIQDNGIVYDIIRIVNKTQNSEVGVSSALLGQGGSVAGKLEPLQVSYGVSLNTNSLSSIGRKFYGGVPSERLDEGGDLQATPIAELGNVIVQLAALQVTSGRSYRFGVQSTVDLMFRPFIGGVVSNTAVTQRRRRKGVGI